MSVFKRKHKNNNDKTVQARDYTVEFKDHGGIYRRLTGFRDKASSEEFERNLCKLVTYKKTGLVFDSSLHKFLDGCSQEIISKLVTWGIVGTERLAAGRPIDEHIKDWKAHLEEFCSAEHARQSPHRVELLFKMCGFKFLTDIAEKQVKAALSRKRKDGSSPRTSNLWQASAKAFLNWMVEDKRLTVNPLANLEPINESTDIRRDRRAFTVDELERLLATAQRGEVVNGMSGEERAVLYLLAVNTGLRWSELRSLKRLSFNFEHDPPIVTIDAKFAKNKKTDDLPLNPDVTAILQVFVADRGPQDKVFKTMWQKHGAAMLRVDLEAAGIEYLDAKGRRADFHSFRHTFGTLLGKAGVSLVYMQTCMRHSDPSLTVRYTDVDMDDKTKSISRLPKLKPRKDNNDDGNAEGGTLAVS